MAAEPKSHESFPREPDPSTMTTAQLFREVSNLEKNTSVQLEAIRKDIERMGAYPTLLDTAKEDIKAQMVTAVSTLQHLHEEKFRRIDTQISERDTRTEQTQRDSKVAVDAAFAAAKEAVGEQNKSNAMAIAKSEAAFTKQIDQIVLLINAAKENNDRQFSDIKASITTTEGKSQGRGDVWGLIVGGVGLLVGLIAIAAALT